MMEPTIQQQSVFRQHRNTWRLDPCRRVIRSCEGLASHAEAGDHGFNARDDSRPIVHDHEGHMKKSVPKLGVIPLDQRLVVSLQCYDGLAKISADLI